MEALLLIHCWSTHSASVLIDLIISVEISCSQKSIMEPENYRMACFLPSIMKAVIFSLITMLM